ncbi:hypothetical protein [uncultured Tessaracoccus sp.]|uniref:hypothetical protein n=1 Tax=uncultured Tessaracoccus sp. TaxID=905023 RepID=UPI002625B7B6|nr:hypothetical protein [uncultured Tessaracoccus sp.]
MYARLPDYLGQRGLQLRRLDEEHYLEFFTCGRDDSMDDWLQRHARAWQEENLCSVWVLSSIDNLDQPTAFFTLSAHQIIPSNIKRGHKAAVSSNSPWVNNLNQAFPAQLLGKFAVDKDSQSTGTGTVLMVCVYAQHLAAAHASAAKFLVVDVQQPALVQYYRKRFGFVQVESSGEMVRMYRPTTAIRQDLDRILA